MSYKHEEIEEKLIAVYTRKSKYTGKGESIANQIELCLNYLKLKFGEDVTKRVVIFEDEGFTGANTNRPEFQRMMNELKNGNYCMLVVYKLDRVSRNVLDFCELKDNLNNWDISFISVTENFDTTTPIGNAMLMIASVFAQLERDTIAERIKDNLHELSKTGRWLGGTTPLGYIFEKISTISIDGKKRSLYQLKLDENIEIVKLIFSKFLELKGLSKVEAYLIKNNIRTRKGKYFSRHAIIEILKNLVYCKADEDIKAFIENHDNSIYENEMNFDGTHGLISYNKKLQGKNKNGKRKNIIKDINEWVIAIGKHEGIIDGKTWIQVWCLLEKNGFTKRKTYGKTQNESLLSGLLRCKHCGSFMRPRMRESFNENGRKNFVYMCELKEKSRKQICNCQNINGIATDTIVLEKIRELISPLSGIRKILNDIIKGNKKIEINSLDLEKQTLLAELNKTESKISGLIDRIALVDADVVKILSNEISKLNTKKEDILKRITELEQEIKKESNIIDIATFTENLLESYYNNWDALELDTKRELIKLLTTNITSDGNEIIINFTNDGEQNSNSPFNMEHNRPSSKSYRSNT